MANKMTDIEYLEWIFNDYYKNPGPEPLTMAEDKGTEHKPHIVKIKSGNKDITKITVYRFDADTLGDHPPFYNRTEKAPKCLKSFCDYVILAEKNDRLFVVLVEMKRGDDRKAETQLNASQMFMDYVLNSAERIKEYNSMPEFSKTDVVFRRIIVKRAATNKLVTKPCDIQRVDKNDVMEFCCIDTLPLHHIV